MRPSTCSRRRARAPARRGHAGVSRARARGRSAVVPASVWPAARGDGSDGQTEITCGGDTPAWRELVSSRTYRMQVAPTAPRGVYRRVSLASAEARAQPRSVEPMDRRIAFFISRLARAVPRRTGVESHDGRACMCGRAMPDACSVHEYAWHRSRVESVTRRHPSAFDSPPRRGPAAALSISIFRVWRHHSLSLLIACAWTILRRHFATDHRRTVATCTART